MEICIEVEIGIESERKIEIKVEVGIETEKQHF